MRKRSSLLFGLASATVVIATSAFVDKRIDAVNQSIFGKLFDAAARRRFIAGHNAWLAYRRAYCVSASDVFEGGTEAAAVDATCTATVNSQHVTDLKAFLHSFGPSAT